MASFGKKTPQEKEGKMNIELGGSYSKREVPRIWKLNPSFKHINNVVITARSIFIVGVMCFFMVSLYLITHDVSLAIGGGIGFLIVFIVVFRTQFYVFHKSFSFKKVKKFNPFQDLLFLLDGETSSTVYICNKKDLVHIGLAIFRIKVIPENVHASVDRFIKALSEYNNMISFTYQIIQIPLIEKEKDNVLDSVQTYLYFCVYCSKKGTLSLNKIKLLKDKMLSLRNILQSNFVGNFHHFQIVRLSGTNLINAFRTYFFKVPTEIEIEDIERRKFSNLPQFFIKAMFCCGLLTSMSMLLSSLGVSFLYIFLINIVLLSSIIYLWWREVLFLTVNKSILKKSNDIPIDPFKNITFFRYRGMSDSLFAHIDNKSIIGIQMFNLALIRPPAYVRFDKFIRGIMNHKILFGYTSINSPVSFDTFYKKYLDYLNLKTFQSLLLSDWRVQTTLDGINWLAIRSGMWQSVLTISVCEFQYSKTSSSEAITLLEEKLHLKALKLFTTFNTHFFNCDLVQLKRRTLHSGIVASIVKNKDFIFSGTHLNYLIIQGKFLAFLTDIVDELKKGITTRIASEFNTPLKLKNNIIIGDTINTEMLETEIPFGFTEEQLSNLLIVNGTYSNRELLAMKIVSQLVEKKKPSLIFDFRGTWSKLLTHFKGTPFEHEFLYFKLGIAFSLDPLKSDIPYDPDNIEFMDYIFGAYALVFQKQKYSIDMMKNAVYQNPNFDMETFNVQLINQNKWENPVSDTLLALFRDLNPQDLTYLHVTSLKTGPNVITFQDFIKDNKTVIIDLSIIVDLPKLVFVSFIIISKIIHYLRRNLEYVEKYIFIPHIDMFFKNSVIERDNDYGKVYKFLDPLFDKGFGLVCGANQMYYLHPNFVKYFENIVSFKTTDKRDMGALVSIMNLQEMHGTGIYSRSRKESYQIQYLEGMKSEEAIVKRSDIYQAFPVCFDWKEIKKQPVMDNEEIMTYMERQGYNLRDTEKMILEQIKKTLFEKDFGIYSGYTPEIKKFLESISPVDQIGNLYEKRLKKELKTILYPKASRYYKDKADIKKCRDEIFTILVKHGYLVENHPKTAGGSESLRTSYSVGSQYKKALDDEFESNQAYSLEPIEEETPSSFISLEKPHQEPRKFIIEKGNLKKALIREFSNFNYDVFTIHMYLEEHDFKNALKLEHDFIGRFLAEVSKHYYYTDKVVTGENLHDFIEHLIGNYKMPFSREELHHNVERFKIINFEYNDIESKAKELYQYLFMFFKKLRKYIYKKSEEDLND